MALSHAVNPLKNATLLAEKKKGVFAAFQLDSAEAMTYNSLKDALLERKEIS